MASRKKRNFWGGYYATKERTEGGKAILWGAEIHHCILSGSYVEDGEVFYLYYCYLCKDVLPDTQGKIQETFDLSLDDADAVAQALMSVSRDTESTSSYYPCVSELLEQDIEEGLEFFQIFEKRAGILVNQFKGFTYEQVLENHPEYLQVTEGENEDGSKYTTDNIRKIK